MSSASKLALRCLIGLAGLVFVVVGVGFVLPSRVSIEREARFQAPLPRVFAQFNDLELHGAWSPWVGSEASGAVLEYGPSRVGTGAWYSWRGPQGSSGKLTIIESRPDEALDVVLDFGSAGQASGHWRFREQFSEVVVTGSFEMPLPEGIAARYTGLALEPMMGAQLEQSLLDLRKHLARASVSMLDDDSR